MKNIPVIYIHFGNVPSYMLRSIESAYERNKNIVVLTDTQFRYKKVKSFDINNYRKDLQQFALVYKHMCSNSYEFEKRCIDRWFVLRNFLVQENIDVCYYTDSDVMIYDDLTTVYEKYKEYDASYTTTVSQENYRWAASACCSYWKKAALNEFCDYVLETYTSGRLNVLEEKWKYHNQNNIPGGICDMTLLYLFSKEINFFPLSEVDGGMAFDHNICVSENFYPDEYEMEKYGDRMIKKITWKNGQPFGNNKILNEQVRFTVLTEYAKLLPESNTLFQRGWRKIKALTKEGI